MGGGCKAVTELTLHRIVEEQGATARRIEQFRRRLHGNLCGIATIALALHLLLARDLVATLQHLHGLAQSAHIHAVRRLDLRRGKADQHVRAGLVGDRLAARFARCRVVIEALQQRLGGADGDRRIACRRHAATRHAKHRIIVDLGTGRRARIIILLEDDAMRGHESPVDDEAPGSGAGEADDFPVIEERHIAFRDQRHAAGLAAVCLVDEAAADQPVGMVDAARKAMLARPENAAVDALGLADRRNRNADALRIVLRPDIVLRLLREGRELQRIVGQHHIGPGLRGAAACQRLDDRAQHVITKLIAAIGLRLADAQQTEGYIIGDRRVRAAAQGFGLGGTRREHGDEPFSMGDQVDGGDALCFVEHGVSSHWLCWSFFSRSTTAGGDL